MTSTTQITLTTSLIFIALFSLAIIGFTVGFGEDNDAAIKITDDADLSSLRTEITSSMTDFKNDSTSTYQSILDTTVEPGSDVVQSAAPFAITPANIVEVSKSIIYLPYKKIFGSGSGFEVFFITFAVFLVLFFGLLLYKTLRGNP